MRQATNPTGLGLRGRLARLGLAGLCVLVGMAIASRAGPKPKELQEALPPGVVRLSLARLHARTLALHHNELQARGRRLTYVYPPEVFADGVKARAWLGKMPEGDEVAQVEKELRALARAIVGEARFAGGVKFDTDEDVTIELAVEGIEETFIYQGGTLRRANPAAPAPAPTKRKRSR